MPPVPERSSMAAGRALANDYDSFRIAVISEPPAAPGAPRELFPPEFEGRTTFLCFIFFVLQAN